MAPYVVMLSWLLPGRISGMDDVVLSWEEQRAQVLQDIVELQELIDNKLAYLKFIDQMMMRD